MNTKLTITISGGREVELTTEEARELYVHLGALFEHIGSPAPVFPYLIWPRWPSTGDPSFVRPPYEVTC